MISQMTEVYQRLMAQVSGGRAWPTTSYLLKIVDRVFQEFTEAGATVVKQPRLNPSGGYSGYVADLDGYLWEIAHNPFSDWT